MASGIPIAEDADRVAVSLVKATAEWSENQDAVALRRELLAVLLLLEKG